MVHMYPACKLWPGLERSSVDGENCDLISSWPHSKCGLPAQVCTVFAQLTVRGKWEGPHVFVVRLRDDQGKIMPGVRILDNGPKVGSFPLA